MKYLSKICPVCRREFTVLSTAEEKATYCTIKCLLESQHTINENELNQISV